MLSVIILFYAIFLFLEMCLATVYSKFSVMQSAFKYGLRRMQSSHWDKASLICLPAAIKKHEEDIVTYSYQ